MKTRILCAVLSVAAAACSSSEERACVPGASVACVGAGACNGFQVCNADGTAFSSCVCAAADASIPDLGFPEAGFADANEDAGPQDSGAPACSPIEPAGQQGCGQNQKCSWIEGDGGAAFECVATGTIAIDQRCTIAADGSDGCQAGLMCLNRLCRTLCVPGDPAHGCEASDQCVEYSGLFGGTITAGACTRGCEPLSQRRPNGSPCPAGEACYPIVSQETTTAVCARAGTVAIGEAITGPAFSNICVPGAVPRRRSPTDTMTSECAALCRPADVFQGNNEALEGGVDPYTCVARGAPPPSDPAAGESCQYWWTREPFEQLSPFSNTLGWCFKVATWTYDTNGDGMPDAPYPRCISLTTGDVVPPIANPPHNDAQYFGCVALP